MILKSSNIPSFAEENPMGGKGHLDLVKMSEAGCFSDGIITFAKASLAPGAEVGYHIHTGDDEAYYFLSGVGEYNDNGKVVTVGAGDFTYTNNGEGHGIKNVGEESLEFIALITKR